MSTLYEKIEACYTAQGKNRKNFAAEIGVPESTIRNWQRYNSVPAADVLYTIAQYFKVSTAYLTGDEDSAELYAQSRTLAQQAKVLMCDDWLDIGDLSLTQRASIRDYLEYLTKV